MINVPISISVYSKIPDYTETHCSVVVVSLPNGDFAIFDDQETEEHCQKMKRNIDKLQKELLQYCDQIMCLAFNSAKYGCNLVENVCQNTSTCTTVNTRSP